MTGMLLTEILREMTFPLQVFQTEVLSIFCSFFFFFLLFFFLGGGGPLPPSPGPFWTTFNKVPKVLAGAFKYLQIEFAK